MYVDTKDWQQSEGTPTAESKTLRGRTMIDFIRAFFWGLRIRLFALFRIQND